MNKKRGTSALALTLLLLASLITIITPAEADGNSNVSEYKIDSVHFQLSFDPTGVKFYDIDGLVGIQKEGMDTTVITGEPLVPVDISSYVIDPYAYDIEIEVISYSSNTIDGSGPILGVPQQVPISQPEEIELQRYTIPLEGPVRLLEGGFIRGYHIQDIAFQPIVPLSDGNIEIHTQVEGNIKFKVPSEDTFKVNSATRSTSAFRPYLQESLQNPEDMDVYMAKPLSSPSSLVLEDRDIQYVIITNTSKVSTHLDDIRDWKVKKGVPTEIVEMSFIDDNYNGTDMQERVRNFIKDAVATWDTEYVLLGGDIFVVPYRSTYVEVGGYYTYDCAADLYYSDLDGDFNADNDSTYGETTDNIDLRPDVFVGRAPAQTSSEMSTFVAKTLKYEIDPLSGYLDNITLAGEFLDTNTNSSLGMDQIKNLILPANINATSLYDSSKGTFGNLNRLTYQAQVNKGLSYAFHSGHCNWNVMSVGTAASGYLYNSNIASYNGGYKIGVMNSIGCIANRFSQNDCIGELHVKESDGGSVVYIGNSRYGWYSPSSPGNGASEVFQRRMATELFTNGNTHMGEHFAYAKNAYTGWSGSYNAYRWLQMALNMIGEPEMHVRTAEPETFNITLPENLGSSYPDFYITVRDENGTLVQDALVCMEQSGFYGYAVTGSNGRAYFNYSTENFDQINVTVTGYNFLPFIGNISVDMTAPSLIVNHNGNATTGDNYEFNCTVTDEAGIQIVFLDVRSEFDDVNETITYYMVRNGTNWTSSIPIAFDSTDDLLFSIRARDNPGNWNETAWDSISVIDNDEPWFTGDGTQQTSTTGENISFKVEIDDNINVTAATLSVWWNGSLETENHELVLSDLNWSFTKDLPIDRVGELRYRVIAADKAGNLNFSLEGDVEVLDNDVPTFIADLTQRNSTTSGTCEFKIDVRDNIELEAVFVEYWRNGYIEHESSEMVLDNGTWTCSISLPEDDLDNIHHIFHAVDTSGNWNQTLEGTVRVLDNEEPIYLRDWTPSNITTGEQVEIRIEVMDNIQVNLVKLFNPLLGKPVNMTMEEDGSNWTAWISAPIDSLDPIEYSFQAWDPFDNTNSSSTRSIDVLDNDGPTFAEPQIPDHIDAGSNLSVFIEVFDNIGVEGAELEWWFGGTEEKTRSLMSFEDNWSTSFNVPLESYGTIYFRIEAWDASGNSMVSEKFNVGIIEYIPPEDPTDDDYDDPVAGDDDDDDLPVDDDDLPADDDDDTTSIPALGEDLDNDDMDDLWEYENGLDHTIDDTSMDPDNDGYTNLEEFEAGTDPQDETSMPLPTGGTTLSDEDTSNLLLVVVVGSIALCLIIILGIAAVAAKRRSHISNEQMVLDDDDDDDDEIMSWD